MATLLIVRIPKPPPPKKVQKRRARSAVMPSWLEIHCGSPRPAGLLVYFASLYFIIGMVDPVLQPMILDTAGPEVMGRVLS